MRTGTSILLFAVCFLMSCSSGQEDPRSLNPHEIYDSNVLHQKLVALSLRPDDHAFLIIEEAKTRKFVQFAGPNIFFDLPKQTLSEAEMKKAREVLARFGIAGPDTYRLGEHGEGPEQTSFQKDLGKDFAEGVKMVEAVLFEVYGFTRPCVVMYDEN